MPFAAFFLSRTALEIYAVLAVCLLLHGIKDGYDERRRDEGRAEIQKQWDADKAQRLKAFADAMTKYVTAQEQAEASAKLLDAERAKRITDAKSRAMHLPAADAGKSFPGSAVRVLNDAASDTAAPAGSAAEPAKSPAQDSTVALVTQWAVDVIGYYNECRDEVIQIQSFYHALQQAQPEVSP